MPTYEATCPNEHGEGFQSFRFFHARPDAVSAECPICDESVPVVIVDGGPA